MSRVFKPVFVIIILKRDYKELRSDFFIVPAGHWHFILMVHWDHKTLCHRISLREYLLCIYCTCVYVTFCTYVTYYQTEKVSGELWYWLGAKAAMNRGTDNENWINACWQFHFWCSRERFHTPSHGFPRWQHTAIPTYGQYDILPRLLRLTQGTGLTQDLCFLLDF